MHGNVSRDISGFEDPGSGPVHRAVNVCPHNYVSSADRHREAVDTVATRIKTIFSQKIE
jgi:hypothetical protein